MRTTTLGSDGPEVGVVGLGCMGMTFAYDMASPHDEATSIAVIRQAVGAGATLIDTADVYGRSRRGRPRAATLAARASDCAAAASPPTHACHAMSASFAAARASSSVMSASVAVVAVASLSVRCQRR